ncbi:MAG: 50S ribosomal protein L4 [Patescibacteria group bacterium]|nr:50S ribosomal protein L4 [Patescibacteria group bacterium]
MPSVKIYNVNGDVVGQAELSDNHFGVKPKNALVHEVVVAQEANSRNAVANTKTRGEVSGGGKKPWKQKGTGRARHGSTRSPIWKGGGVTFGPRGNRNFSVKINRKTKQKVLFMVLSDKVNHEQLLLIDVLPIETPKTAVAAKWFKQLPVGRRTMVVTAKSNPTLLRMVKNLPNVQLTTVNALHVADMIKFPTILFEKDAVEAFESLYK